MTKTYNGDGTDINRYLA